MHKTLNAISKRVNSDVKHERLRMKSTRCRCIKGRRRSVGSWRLDQGVRVRTAFVWLRPASGGGASTQARGPRAGQAAPSCAGTQRPGGPTSHEPWEHRAAWSHLPGGGVTVRAGAVVPGFTAVKATRLLRGVLTGSNAAKPSYWELKRLEIQKPQNGQAWTIQSLA